MEIACSTCGFELWKPYGKLSVSTLGLYSDSRFPGRSILQLDEHFDQLDELPSSIATAFMADIQTASLTLRELLGSPRMNTSILGNTESHVHAHLIPRYPEQEERPHKSPWDDPRLRTPLAVEDEEPLLEKLRASFNFPG